MRKERLIRPTWPHGPAICSITMLPAHESPADAKAFLETLPAFRLDRIEECPFCDGWHHYGKMRAPSGDSSGSSRR